MSRESTEIRQVQIKKAVLEIISEEGLNKLSTRNLANRVGLTEGAIFRHFKTKKDIIKSIMEDVRTGLVGKLRDIAYSPKKPDEKLFSYLCKNVKYLKENRGITILLFSEAAHMGDTDLKQHLNVILSEQKKFIINIVKDGQLDGLWREDLIPEDFATIYMGIPITFNIEMILNKENFNIDNFCKRMYVILINSLKK